MSTLTRRDYRGSLAEMVEWLEAPWTLLRPAGSRLMRVEDFVRDDSFVIRAELPGVDPDKDVEVTVADGMLTIKAERREEIADKHHSEFRYGTFERSMTLPPKADEQSIEALYGHGILEVTVKLTGIQAAPEVRTIPVRQNQHIKAS